MTDDVAVYGAALLLAPQRRDAYLLRNWKATWRKNALKNTKAIWVKDFKDKYSVEDEATPGDGPEQEPDAFDLFEREQSLMNTFKDKDELQRFIDADPVKLSPGQSALDWWLHDADHTTYPNLCKMVIAILSIPPMSAEPERIFSGARRTISWSRFRLGPANIERNECLKSWLRSGIADEWRSLQVDEEQVDSEVATPSQSSRYSSPASSTASSNPCQEP
jgi:hypothetical protein